MVYDDFAPFEGSDEERLTDTRPGEKYDDLAPFEGSEGDSNFDQTPRSEESFLYSHVGQTVNKDVETENHEGMMAGQTTFYLRKVDIEGFESAAEVRSVWNDGMEVKSDIDRLYALREDGQVDIWTAYPSNSNVEALDIENTEYGGEPDHRTPLEDISDERALKLLGGN